MSRRIDVLIPHYADPIGLELSLRSVCRQKGDFTFRIVVADDGSPDAIWSKVRELVERQSLPVELIRSDKNEGRPRTRNRLLDAIDSAHVAWLDAGDVWYPNKTARQWKVCNELDHELVGCLKSPPTWVTCDYDWNWDDGRSRAIEQVISGDQLRSLLEGRVLQAYLWTVLAPAHAVHRIGYFDERLPHLQDLDFFVRHIESGGRIVKPRATSALPLCAYEKSDVGRDARKIRACNVYLRNKYRKLYLRYGKAFTRRCAVHEGLILARVARNNGATALAARYLISAVMGDPIEAIRSMWQMHRIEYERRF